MHKQRSTNFILRNIKFFLILTCFFPITLALPACGEAPVKEKAECQKDEECSPSESCQKGKCINSDEDNDGWSPQRGDCNDKNVNIYPSAPEICGSLIDENCDGKVDEKPCQCLDGTSRECGLDEGECQKGQQKCESGIWSKCAGGLIPTDETCDGKDNNCNGEIDENVANCCQPNQTEECGTDKGECVKGKKSCQSGIWTKCIGIVKVQKEECNGKDDDCDGHVDNDTKDKPDLLRKDCYSGTKKTRNVGACRDGFQPCKNGQWDKCEQEALPKKEECNGKDDDCDGKLDNQTGKEQGLAKPCYGGPAGTAGKGSCQAGTMRCAGGSWTTCLGEISPSKEVCNGQDDDCDGKTDNLVGKSDSLQQTCYSGTAGTKGKGPCKEGSQFCKNGRWQKCKGEVAPKKDDCNGKDDDCDGKIDNQAGTSKLLGGDCYSGPKGTAGKGPCKKGTRKCTKGKWTKCLGQILPSKEVCDNKDNDCDGKSDGLSRSCYDIKSGCVKQSNGTYKCRGVCKSGKQACTKGGWGICANQVLPKSSELCNNKDDDCDGSVDEGNPGANGGCNVAKFPTNSPCRAGKYQCTKGKLICKQKVFPTKEKCNRRDDDCDGLVDEGNPGSGRACTISKFSSTAPCRIGKGQCINGRLLCKQTVSPKREVCNGRDDDCDGPSDEGVSCSKGSRCSGTRGCTRCSQPSDRRCSRFLGICTSSAKCPSCVCGYKCVCTSKDTFGTCKNRSCRP